MNAVLDYLETYPNYGLYGLSAALCSEHNLQAMHGKISGNDVLHLSRKTNMFVENDNIHNDATIILLDDILNVINIAPPMALKMKMEDLDTLPITENTPVVVSELFIGKLVTIALYNQTYVISTKDDLHGSLPIKDGLTVSTQEIFLDLLDRIDPMGGTDGLFRSNRGGINCRKFSYSFVLSPKNGKFTDNFLDYNLYMVALYDLASHMFKTPEQIASLCQQLNYGATTKKILLPSYKKIYSVEQLKTAIFKYSKCQNVRGVYLLDESMNAAYVTVENTRTRYNPEKYMYKLVGSYLKYDYLSVLREKQYHSKLAPLVNNFVLTYYSEAEDYYEKIKSIRTDKTFHESVKNHRTKLLLYAMRKNRIKSITELYKVFTPNKIIKMMLNEYGVEKINKLIEEQEDIRKITID